MISFEKASQNVECAKYKVRHNAKIILEGDRKKI